MKKNLRFYSLVAALATVYSVAPGRVIAQIRAECAETNYSEYFLQEYNSGYSNYGTSDACNLIISNHTEQVPSNAYSICTTTINQQSPITGYGYCDDQDNTYGYCLTDEDCCPETCNSGICAGQPLPNCGNSGGDTPSGGHTINGGSTLVNYSCSDTSSVGTITTACNSLCPWPNYNFCNSLTEGTGAGTAFPQGACRTLDTSTQYRVVDIDNSNCSAGSFTSSGVVYSCNQCNSSYPDRLPLETVLEMEPGVDFYSYNGDLDISGTYAGIYNNDGPIGFEASGVNIVDGCDKTFYVCVQCALQRGSWYSSEEGYEERNLFYNEYCNKDDDYEYRCATGWYGTAASDYTGCEVCPQNADNCNEPGVTDFTCKAGYYKSNGDCVACPSGTYQPNGGNASGSASCIPCPKHKDTNTSWQLVQGQTQATAQTKVESCYQGNNINFIDIIGTYHFNNACYYRTNVDVGS